MPKPISKKRANEFVGIFVLMALGVVVAAVLLGPHTRRWLTTESKLLVRLPPEGSLGLRKGADVLILGSVVGSVDDIAVSDAGEMEAQISIRGDFIRFVRRDSQAFIRKPFGIGDASIEITRGKGDPLSGTDAVIQSASDKAPTQVLEETLGDIRTEIVPALHELRTAAEQYHQLATDLRGQQPGLTEAIGHINRVAANVEGGKGVVGMLLSDPAPAEEIRQAIPKLAASIEDLRSTAADLRKLASTLPELKRSAQAAVDEAPGLLLQIDESFRQIQLLAEAMQHNWLLGGSVDHPSSVLKISADHVGTDR